MYAEMFDRVGMWQFLTQVPIWFNGGIAMQVDWRKKYSIDSEAIDTSYVRSLEKASEFFASDSRQLTHNYAAAKVEVAKLLNTIDHKELFELLDQLGTGHDFSVNDFNE